MKIAASTIVAITLLTPLSRTMADGDVTYQYISSSASGPYYLITGDNYGNELYVYSTLLNDGRTPGVMVVGVDTTINGAALDRSGLCYLQLTQNVDIRFNMNGGADLVSISMLDQPDRRISFDGGWDYVEDTCKVLSCSYKRLYLQRADTIQVRDTTVADVLINQHIRTYANYKLNVDISASTIYGNFELQGTPTADTVTVDDVAIFGLTELEMGSGDDALIMSDVNLELLTADFDRGNDLISCTGGVLCAQGSYVFGGSEGRVNRSTVKDYDTISIASDAYFVYLGNAGSWTYSNYND